MMIFRLADTLTLTRRYLSPDLVTPSAFGTIAAIARSVPPGMTAFGFECRLAEAAPRVDLGMSVSPSNGGRELLATWLSRRALPRGPWRRLREFFRQWTSPDCPLHHLIPLIYFEFDADRAVALAGVPSIFALLDWSALPRARRQLPGATTTDVGKIEHLVRVWLGARALASVAPTLRATVNGLPRGGCIMNLGAMLGRRDPSVRASVRVPRTRLRAYLTRVGWPHWSAAVEDVLTAIAGESPALHLDFDVGQVIGPALGFQFWGAPKGSPEPSWRHLLDRLVALGLCTSSKRRAVLAWPGATKEVVRGLAWPCRLQRYISNIKVSYTPRGVLEAKVYLAAAPTFTLL